MIVFLIILLEWIILLPQITEFSIFTPARIIVLGPIITLPNNSNSSTNKLFLAGTDLNHSITSIMNLYFIVQKETLIV